MTDSQDNRQQICWKLEFENIQIVSKAAKDKHKSKSRALDLIISEWYQSQLNKQNNVATAKHSIQEIRNTVDSIDRRLSRIEQNIMTNGSILAK